MKHMLPEELRESAVVTARLINPMTRAERLARWAELLEKHDGPITPLYRIEYLSPADRRAYRGGSASPLGIAYADAAFRADGLADDTLGSAMDYFEMTDEDTHELFCDCNYMGTMTGRGLANRLHRYVEGGGVMAWARGIFGRYPG